MRPLGRWLVGAIVIGGIVGATTWIVFAIGEYGSHFWNSDTKDTTAAFAVVGAVIGSFLRNKIRSVSRAGAGKVSPE